MAEKQRLLVLADGKALDEAVLGLLMERFEVVSADFSTTSMGSVAAEPFSAVFLLTDGQLGASKIARLLQSEQILAGMPDAVALLDSSNRVVWANEKLIEWSGQEDVVGKDFYFVMGKPEIIGPDFCPFHTALSTRTASSSTLRTGSNQYFKVHAAPAEVADSTSLPIDQHPVSGGPLTELAGTKDDELTASHLPAPSHLIVTLRDVSAEVLQNQKLGAIHQAGMELADIKLDELREMDVADRIELLKSNILHYTKDLLNFDLIEIRLLDPKSGCLEPLLSAGIDPKAAGQDIFARPQSNGVTGFVAATGKSYLCEDTQQDPLYLQGAEGAKSSLTVPLILHDEVIGTFNAESTELTAFSESDLQFLEIFSREIALALNTLDLLAAEQVTTAVKSIEAIYSAVALPVDDILNDAVSVLERFIGHEPELTERLQRILKNTRDIKRSIQRVGEEFTASDEEQPWQASGRPLLQGRRVLVVDEDETVRSAAHELLERYGCVVETAHNGAEAICMLRATGPDTAYDCIIADIRLPDMSGYDLMLRLKDLLNSLPLLLMTGFGYDPGHSIVKARKAGLKAVLYKPFRLEQLLDSVEMIVTDHATNDQAVESSTSTS